MIRKLILIISISISVFFAGCNKEIKQPIKKVDTFAQYNKVQKKAWFGTYKEFLIEAEKYDFSSKYANNRKKNHLLYAIYSDKKPCKKINYMLENGLKINSFDNVFLNVSGRWAKVKGLKCIVKLGVNIQAVNTSKQNILHKIAYSSHIKEDFLKYLLSLKININKKDWKGYTPLDIAYRKNNKLAIKLFKKAGGIYSGKLDTLTLEKYIEKHEIQILTEYFTNDLYKIDKPIYPTKPKEPELPNIKKLTKGEFETTKQFKKRVRNSQLKRDNKIQEIQNRYDKKVANYNKKVKKISDTYNSKIKYLEKNKEKIKALGLKKAYMHHYGKPIIKDIKYVADEEQFYGKLVSSKGDLSYDIKFHVPIKEAKKVKNEILKSTPKVKFEYKNNNMILKDIVVKSQKNNYLAYITDKKYKNNNIEISINNNLKLEKPKFATTKLVQNSKQNIAYVKQSVDQDLLRSKDELEKLLLVAQKAKINKNSYAIVVGIEEYKYEDSVNYSSNSAKVFSKYLHKTLGVPKDNIWLYNTADSTGKMNLKIEWANFLQMIDKDSTVY